MAYFISNKFVNSSQWCLGGCCSVVRNSTCKLCLQITLLHDWLFNVLDYIDIHDYVSPSLLLLLLPLLLLLSLLILLLVLLFMLLATITATILLLLLPKAMHSAAVPATHSNTKVSSDVTELPKKMPKPQECQLIIIY